MAWAPGKTHRALRESFQVGGKGINVAKMLARFGVPATACCFAGGASGEECAGWLRSQLLPHRIFLTHTPTRVGTVVRAPQQPETTFLGPDAAPDAEALRHCAEFFTNAAPGCTLALCGSFPGWDSPAARPLRDAFARLLSSTRLAADTYGPLLAWLVEHPVWLVKINRGEFDQLFPVAERARPLLDRLEEARTRWPVHRWIVTDGPGAVAFAALHETPATLTPPPVIEVSATGSGDVLFASVLHALLNQGASLRDAVAFALPYASANAASLGVADFDMNNLPQPRSLPAV
jgi:fructose-1-phosphate kinase PfkB-like protein